MKSFRMTQLAILLMPFTFHAMTIDEMVQQTLNTNPQMQQRLSELRSVEYDLEKAYAGYKPSLDLYGKIGPERTHIQGSGADNTTNILSKEASLTLSENLFSGFNTEYDAKEQKSRIEAAKYFALQEANSILLKFMTSYLDIMKNRQILNIEHQNIKAHERINNMMRKKTEQGYGSKTDVDQSEARKILAYSNYIVQHNNYKDSISNFEHYYGKIVVADQMPEAITADLPSYNLDELVEFALQNNPTIQIEKFNIETQDNKYSKDLSSFYPSLDAELSVAYTNSVNNIDGSEYDRDSAKALLKLNYNLYNGGYDESLRLQNLEEKSAYQYSYQENKRAVTEKLKLAFNSYIHNKNRVKCLKVYIKLTKATAESYVKEYYFGRRTLLDLLNVEQESINAQKELINAEHELFLATYRILDALGVTASAFNTNLYQIMNLKKPELQGDSQKEATLLKDLQEDTDFIDMDSVCAEPEVLNLGIIADTVKNDNTAQGGIIIDKTDPDNVKIDLVNIQFEYRSTKLSVESKKQISSLAKRMSEKKNVIMEIHGHTDNIGSHTYNEKLSRSRAQSAKDELVKNGIKADRIQIFGHAFDKPVATNKTKKGRAQNRRIEFIIKNKETRQ